MTGEGDCHGLNAAIRAVVQSGMRYNLYILGIQNGWKELIDGDLVPLRDSSVSGIISGGGTVLGKMRRIR